MPVDANTNLAAAMPAIFRGLGSGGGGEELSMASLPSAVSTPTPGADVLYALGVEGLEPPTLRV